MEIGAGLWLQGKESSQPTRKGKGGLKYLALISIREKSETCPFLPGCLQQCCCLLGSGFKAGQTCCIPQPHPLVANAATVLLCVPQAQCSFRTLRG